MRIRSIVIAFIVTTTFALFTDAATITATFDSVAGGGIVVIPSLNGASLGAGLAGQYLWTQNSGTPVLGSTGQFVTFCIELTQDINFNQPPYEYTIADLATAPRPSDTMNPSGMGSAKADQIRELWGQDYSKVVDNSSAATFQFAIWRILYGNSLTLDAGNAGLLATADGWINALDSNGRRADLIALTSPTAQDQITIATPLPSGAWGGLLLIGVLRIFRVRRNARLEGR